MGSGFSSHFIHSSPAGKQASCLSMFQGSVGQGTAEDGRAEGHRGGWQGRAQRRMAGQKGKELEIQHVFRFL